ncbi:MAG: ankyrin repeat domain-containing protein [Sedimentisphaerales bacterium]|nr:ankyrin repeat domain-containing protein [Sedimentisphaerales bacterium]
MMKKHGLFIFIFVVPVLFASIGKSGDQETVTKTIEILPPGGYITPTPAPSKKGKVIADAFEQADITGEKAKLVRAVKNSNLSTVKKLLAKGIDPDWKDKDGLTSLMWAASMGNIEITKALLAGGADVNMQSKYGDTALVLAKQMDRTEIVELLEASGAKENIIDSIKSAISAKMDISAKDAEPAETKKEGNLAIVKNLFADADKKDGYIKYLPGIILLGIIIVISTMLFLPRLKERFKKEQIQEMPAEESAEEPLSDDISDELILDIPESKLPKRFSIR